MSDSRVRLLFDPQSVAIIGASSDPTKASGLPLRNIAKSNLLYDLLDQTRFYVNPVRREDRSRMNVPFKLADASLDERFLAGAQERGMIQLKGHRSVGGMRASIYNAMPVEGVQALCDYMREFERRHG